MNKSRVLPIASFFVLAFALSWLANTFIGKLNFGGLDVQTIIAGFGPALSGLICYKLFKTPNSYGLSFGGTKPLICWGVVAVSLVLPILLSHSVNKALVVSFVLTQFFYTIGEELGWRHYLQNATFGINKWLAAFVIGTAWFFWHYSILANPIKVLSGQNMPLFIGIPLLIIVLSLFSLLLGGIVIKTRSVLLPVLIHYVTKVNSGPTFLLVLAIVVTLDVLWNRVIDKRPATA